MRSVFDVYALREGRLRSAWNKIFGAKTVNLRPKFRVRHPLVAAGAVIILVFFAIFAARRLFVRAEVVDFYPASCLGTWQSPEKAQGTPESLASGAPIDASSSAVWDGPSSQIFCGGFVPPDTDETGNIKSVGLTLAWNVTGLPASTESSSSSSSSTSFHYQFMPLAFLIPAAHAQDASGQDATETDTSVAAPQDAQDTTEPPPAVVVVPTDAASSTPSTTAEVLLGPPLSAPLAPIDTTTISTTVQDAAQDASSTPAPLPPPPPSLPDENFLLLSYSMDGNIWIPLQKVNPGNWQNLTVSLPITQWSDLKKIQIKIEGMPTALAVQPQVFLDGMFMEVHYDVPPVFALTGDTNTGAPTSSQTVQISPSVTLEIPPQKPIPFVPAPTIVDVIKENARVSVVVQYVGDFYEGNPLYLFMYPQGTTAERNGAESAYTFAQQPGQAAVNPLPVGSSMLDPTTKQATVVLVAPSPDGDQAASGDMADGSYVIDASYYDGTTWHLVSPTIFTWP